MNLTLKISLSLNELRTLYQSGFIESIEQLKPESEWFRQFIVHHPTQRLEEEVAVCTTCPKIKVCEQPCAVLIVSWKNTIKHKRKILDDRNPPEASWHT